MFRKTPCTNVTEHVTNTFVVTESVVEPEMDDNGRTINVVVTRERDLLDPAQQLDLPTPEEMSLENRIAAGIPLQELPCGHVLTPDDPADMVGLADNVLPSINSQIVVEDEN